MYPELDLYPFISAVAGHSEAGTGLHLPQVYPRIILCQNPTSTNLCERTDLNLLIDPAVYPELDLYPPVSAETGGIPKTGTCVSR